MAHEEYRRIIPGADTAVLFIHGILGTPNHFAAFLPLVPEGVSVVNLLLDGHGNGVQDFSHTSLSKWEAQVEHTVDSLLADHRNVYIAAHSLGTLLAIEQAVKKPLAGLFLLAVPIRLCIKPRIIATSWKLYFNQVEETDFYATAAKNCCGVTLHKNPLLYFGWIPRFLDLFRKIRMTRCLLNRLAVPCMAYQSEEDELVSKSSAAYLKAHSHMRVSTLKRSSHYYYEPADFAYLQQEFIRFLS